MRETTSIDPKWLVEFAPAFFRFSDPTKLSRRKRQERIEPLYNRWVWLWLTDGAVGGAGEALPQIGAVGEGWGSELGRRATLQQVGVVVGDGWGSGWGRRGSTTDRCGG